MEYVCSNKTKSVMFMSKTAKSVSHDSNVVTPRLLL